MKQRKWSLADRRRGGASDDLGNAISLHRAGQFSKARQRYERILAVDRNHVVALHFLGVLDHQCGQSEQGIGRIERAIRLAPGYADAHNNLGNILKETNQLEAALRAYQRVVDLVPDHADAWNNLGVVLRGQGRYEEAEHAYTRALDANPAHIAAWQNRASLLARLNRFDDAVAAYRRVLELRPRYALAYEALGRTLYRAGDVTGAIAIYQEWLEAEPGNSVAKHMLAACSGDTVPTRASDAYVRDTFDAFAGSFDQVLDQLGYRAPALIRELLERVLPSSDGSLAVADVGCGTGLCAEFLRPRAKVLAGVDLSPAMLAKARAAPKYDQLVEAELVEWLASHPPTYDLIVSADTLCYLGALEEALAAARTALKSRGLLVFTLEHAGDDTHTYRLNPSGRYSHAEPYVLDVVKKAMFASVTVDRVTLRKEIGHDVSGLLVSARAD
jgi:predicted TPR repeat methyltransferase